PLADPLASVNGPDSLVTFEMDTLHSLSIGEQGGDPDTTAYGLLADFVNAMRK
ncbi:MAG: homoserine dehydrogenase, partial [Chloroflexi bacterium]|nr:homoserine dehydrogenase [Chloroflexota bacterium]